MEEHRARTCTLSHQRIGRTVNTVRSMSKIDHRFNVPVNAILAVALFNMLFGLLYLGPAVAFNAYISSCTIFLNCSYAGPIMILLVRGRNTITLKRPDFPLGRVGGYLFNYIAVVYVVVTSAVCSLSVSCRAAVSGSSC
jgi:choline transport protein